MINMRHFSMDQAIQMIDQLARFDLQLPRGHYDWVAITNG